jgi:hypothetical protein
MQVVERHGGGSHYVRPDRVYRTGVLTSTMGYDPGADVQDVAASFTQFPADLALPADGLSGLGAGPIDKLRMKFAAWKARRRARQFMGMDGSGLFSRSRRAQAPGQILAQEGDEHEPKVFDPRHMPGGSYPQIGERYLPQELVKEQMVAQLTSGGVPHAGAQAQVSTAIQHWTNRWWNG